MGELAATKKKLDNQAETLSIGQEESSFGSRSSSSSSLHRGDDASGKPDISREVVKEAKDAKQGMEKEIKKVKEGMETQQMLVEKIVGLQRACAKRQENLSTLGEEVSKMA